MMNCCSALFSFLLLMLSYMALGQNYLGIPLVYQYDKSVFQGGSRTWSIKQDSKDVMYFGNNAGLFTFDGSFWNRYHMPNHSIVRSIHIDAQDRVYVGGQGDFGYFDHDVHSGLNYFSLYEQIPQEHRQFADIWNTVEFDRAVFFRSNDLIFEYKENRIAVHKASSSWDFLGRAGDRLFAQDTEHGLLEFKKGKWIRSVNENPFKGTLISSISAIGNDSVWISTVTGKTYLFHANNLKLVSAGPNYEIYTPSRAKINDDEYVTATASEGCIISNLDGRVLQRIGIAHGLPNHNVSVVFVDRQKNIWAGVDNAIVVISYGSAIKHFRPNLENDVTGYSTRVFENNLYLSSSNGVYRVPLSRDVEDHSLSPGAFSLVQGSDGGEAWRLEDINGQLLLAHNQGLFMIRDNVATSLVKGTGAWMFLPLSSVYPIQYALVGTYQGMGMLLYTAGRFQYDSSLQGTADSYRFLERDHHGDIWGSHPYRGIYRLRLSADKNSYDAQLFTMSNGLPSTYQNYVFTVRNDVVFAAEDGIYSFDSAHGHFVPSKDLHVFRGMPIKYLKEDPEGNIWFCSGNKIGVARYFSKERDYRLQFFPEIEGLYTSGFENIYPYDPQNIYVGSEKGVLHINYAKYQQMKVKPTVLLSQIICSGEVDTVLLTSHHVTDTSGVLDQRYAQTPVLNASFDSFQFKFTSPSYGIYADMTYSYWLDGYDNDWSVWGVNTEKNYTNLPSGTYTFKIKARNNFYEESDIVSYTFVIRPPWYLTSWAWIGYFAIFLLAIAVLIKWQHKAWYKRQSEFEQELKQLRYIHQLELEKNEKEIIKLQNEKLASEVESKTKELASASMQLMESSGALSKLRVKLAKLELGEEDDAELKRITALLKDVENNTVHWDQFAAHFDELNDGFLHRLKSQHANLSRNDLKVCAYLRLHFSTKQIAQLQNISVRGVEIHRYRIRKKLGVETEISLSDYLGAI